MPAVLERLTTPTPLTAWQDQNPLRLWRAQQQVGIHKAAALLEVNQVSIQLWEKGKTIPHRKSLKRLAQKTGIADLEQQWMQWLSQRPHPEKSFTPTPQHLSVSSRGREHVFLEFLQAILPLGKHVYLRDHGITHLPLYCLNQALQTHGLMIHAQKVQDPKRVVTCTEQDGQEESYGLFTLKKLNREEER